MVRKRGGKSDLSGIRKAPTGIDGLDEVTAGGFPAGRPTLLCGHAGCGKTVLAMEFLINGAAKYNEPGLFVSFEEDQSELRANFASFGPNLKDLMRRKRIAIDYIPVERSEIMETGEYDLEGLFVRLAHAVDAIGAKRVALDTIEALFSGFSNAGILRAELRRLFRWLKSKGLTAVVTGERGENTLTRHGLEEYVADCVILLDHLVSDRIATRRLKIVKYRGSTHGTNEFPFLISKDGVSILPVTSLELCHGASTERVSSGVASLDLMFGGKGYYRGSSILVSGSPGSGKTSLAAHFVDAACRRGEKCAFFSFEESPAQVMRNMASVGFDLGKWVDKGLLRMECWRPTAYGLEKHLADIHRTVEAFGPRCVALDPISGFIPVGAPSEVKSMLLRIVDYLKTRFITTLITDLVPASVEEDCYGSGISSIADTWLSVTTKTVRESRERVFSIVKSRGMDHSARIVKLVITNKGVRLEA